MELDDTRSVLETLSRAKEGMRVLTRENRRLREEMEVLQHTVEELGREVESYQSRYLEVERQSELYLNLYVSGLQLLTSVGEENVLETVREILLNLVGAEVFAVWMVDAGAGRLEGMLLQDECRFFEGGHPMPPRKAVEMLGDPSSGEEAGEEPLVSITLNMGERPLGVLAIYKLLEQKRGLSSLDRDLLELLASGAPALLGSGARKTQDGESQG